ncbi:MAG: metallophosphoesterase [Paludibacteraceae bacterium]|nr:metallophosphoesterase [Paludibacteraceae bacterium]
MKPFFFIVFLVYVSGVIYFINRVQILVPEGIIRTCFVIVLSILFSLFIVQFSLKNILPICVNEVLYRIGTMALPILFYGIMAFITYDLVRWLLRLFTKNDFSIHIFVIAIILLVVCVAILSGIYFANQTKIVRYDIKTERLKSLANVDSMKIVVVSDIHMGYVVGESKVSRLVNLINEQKPDLCLFVGDLFDGDTQVVIERNIGASLSKIQTRYGTFAVLGNHEYIGDVQQNQKYLQQLGISVLRDESVEITNGFRLIGRDDMMSKSKQSLLSLIDTSSFNLVMDHQPMRLQESIDNEVDIHLSGHTHKGQIFPLGYITKSMFLLDYGYQYFEKTHVVVTSGFGTWGPPVRIGSQSEIVVLNLVSTSNF